ncbi:MAG: hypothetical protein JNL54_21910 [Kineosporiaceae bacterium]|nr:hypothetical protein [Kineosporiaceae bacterium]
MTAAGRSPRTAAAARRARVLTTVAVFAATSWAVVALPQVSFWVAVPATVLLVADLVVLGVSGRRRSARRRARARQSAMRVVAAEHRTASRARRAPAAVPRQDRAIATPPGAGPNELRLDLDAAASGETGARAAERAAAERRSPTEADGDTWTPVPVPRPTYMLKPVVPRSAPAPLGNPVDGESLITPSAAPRGQGGAGAAASSAAAGTGSTAASEGVAPAGAPSAPSVDAGRPPRPWEVEHTWADDLDVFLARRRAANG